ncbi:MAG: response regulator [Oscillochloridaceae bacterium umkhey_bin13]
MKILLVDDEPALAVMVERELVLAGYQVIHVTSGASALSAHAQHQPDLVILDWMLPERDGLSVLREWQQLLHEGRDGLLIGGLLFLGSLTLIRLVLRDPLLQLWPLIETLPTALALSVGGIAYLVFRTTLRCWLIWDRLRRQRRRWALTHAHLSVVAAAALLLALLIVGSAAMRDPLERGAIAAANPFSAFAGTHPRAAGPRTGCFRQSGWHDWQSGRSVAGLSP